MDSHRDLRPIDAALNAPLRFATQTRNCSAAGIKRLIAIRSAAPALPRSSHTEPAAAVRLGAYVAAGSAHDTARTRASAVFGGAAKSIQARTMSSAHPPSR